MKKIKVVEIYFEEDLILKDALSPFPVFVLEDGRIKKSIYKGLDVVWVTDEEKKMLNLDKK